MKEEEPVDGKKSEDDGIEKENLAILEKIRKNQRQDHLNVSAHSVRSPFPTSLGGGEHAMDTSSLSSLCTLVCRSVVCRCLAHTCVCVCGPRIGSWSGACFLL